MSEINMALNCGRFLYGKLNELELHEVAMLAGLPQSPNGYNPYKNPER